MRASRGSTLLVAALVVAALAPSADAIRKHFDLEEVTSLDAEEDSASTASGQETSNRSETMYECSEVVQKAVKRKHSKTGGKCKCPRGYELFGNGACSGRVGKQLRYFNPDELRGLQCTCMKGGVAGEDEGEAWNPDFATWDWMSELEDDRPLYTLTLPGTHDTMAWEFAQGHLGMAPTRDHTGMALTHQDNIDTQLQRGIRWFDVRIGFYQTSSTSEVVSCHGGFHMQCNLACFLDRAGAFLTRHASEVIFVMLKPECANKGEDLTNQVVAMLRNRDNVLFGDPIHHDAPLGDLRGKIVVVDTQTWDSLRGFAAKAQAPEERKVSFLPMGGHLSGKDRDVQNDFLLNGVTTGRESKVAAIVEFLESCANEEHATVQVNYFSAAGPAYNVIKTAEYVNTKIMEKLEAGLNSKKDHGHAFGACLLDGLPLAGPVVKLVKRLIDRNFHGFRGGRGLNKANFNDQRDKMARLIANKEKRRVN